MQPAEIVAFSVMLFLALACLIKWKRRRDMIAARLNRGLRGYVEAKSTVEYEEVHWQGETPRYQYAARAGSAMPHSGN